MAYRSNFVYLVAKGHFGTSVAPGVEQWQAGFKFHAPSGADYSLTNRLAFATAVAPAFQAFHTSSTVLVGNKVFLAAVTAAHIGTDGKYVAGGFQTTAEYKYPTAVPGANSGDLPFSTAAVLSLRTARPRGRGSAGRAYWPNTAMGVQQDTGTLTTAAAQGIANAAKVMLDLINVAAGARFGEGAALIVASNLDSGIESYVTRVGVGLKLDSQERREKRIAENHQFATLVPPPTTPIDPVFAEAQDNTW